MTWGRQVLHVVKKDLREHWVWIAALVAAVGVAAMRIQAWSGVQDSAPVTDLPDFATMLLLVTTALVIVQSDPPARTSAFWATLPLRKSAVAVAKLGVMVLLLLLVSVGAFAALRLSEAEPVLLHAGLASVAANTLLLLVIVMTIAAMTADVKGAILGILLLFVGLFASMSVIGRMFGFEGARIGKYTALVGTLMACGLLIPLYRAREHSWLLRGASALVLTALLIIKGIDPPRPKLVVALPVDSTLVSLLNVDRAALMSPEKREIEVQWVQWMKNRGSIRLQDAQVIAHLSDGTRKVLRAKENGRTSGSVSIAGDSSRVRTTHTLELDRKGEEARLPKLARNVVRLTVEATIVELFPQEVYRGHIRDGTRDSGACGRLRITLQRPDSSGLVLQQRSVGMTTNALATRSTERSAFSEGAVSYKLEWPGLPHSITLDERGGSWRSTFVSFPGLQACGADAQFIVRGRDRQALRADTSWMTNSVLVVSEQKIVRAKRIVATAIVQ